MIQVKCCQIFFFLNIVREHNEKRGTDNTILNGQCIRVFIVCINVTLKDENAQQYCCIEYSGLLVAEVEACLNVTQHQWSLNRINTEIHNKCLIWLISGGGGLDLQCMTENMTALSHFMYSHLIPADRRGLKIS